jgi:hypothetical protein
LSKKSECRPKPISAFRCGVIPYLDFWPDGIREWWEIHQSVD